jgi:bifunctional N6-L-threonylcarbamoyladenine synthase / protein kinase Bud32
VLVLGIEGTAHTCGVGIVEAEQADPGRCVVRANEVDMLRPEAGGIHPREAADHHVAVLPGLVGRALQAAGVEASELDGIAFSQGPGLGPCLRTVATTARALALRYDIPLMGVNHCVAHLEIARAVTPASDPVMLYASGANTQVIGESRGRYRVFGETLDVGIGNALDKFARDQGIPFPGGPRVEALAREGAKLRAEREMELPVLPYTVKGMDVAFSGLVTAANALVRDGVPLEVVCEAVQEWAFSPLVEVTERALAHTGKKTVVLGGGVGRNQRLQSMLSSMASQRGAEAYWPEPGLLSDNGAMIAWNGVLLLRSGHPTPIEASKVRQRYRTDQVPLVWREADGADGDSSLRPTTHQYTDELASMGQAMGAEATVQQTSFLERPAVVKTRLPKDYRSGEVEALVVARRTRHEAKLLVLAQEAGVRVPALWDASAEDGVVVMEAIAGSSLKVIFEGKQDLAEKIRLISEVGRMVARLHKAGIVHGDLTTSNLLTETEGEESRPVLIDFGLASHARDDPEAQAVDLHVLQEALEATHKDHKVLWEAFLTAYLEASPQGGRSATAAQLQDLESRGRYRSIVA